MIVVKVTMLSKREPFNVKVDTDNYLIIRQLLIEERLKIINKLKNYKSAGLIGSIFYPRNKTMQNELDDLVKKKRIIKNSIEKINKVFLR